MDVRGHLDGLRDTWVTRVKWVSRDTWVCEDSPRTLDSPSVGSKRCVFGKIVLVEVSCLIRYGQNEHLELDC